MAYTLTVGGYQFENPPEEYRKLARLSNSPQTAFNRSSTAFYQSNSQDLQFQIEGTLALDPALGGSDDLAELERLQSLAIDGGEVDVEFDPFFSGKCVIEDDPFRQSGGESDYAFTFTVNSEFTDSSAYPAHSSPNTGNTFEFGDLDLGYDPNQVAQNYEKQTEQVKRLQGVARSTDTEGLIPKVNVSGMIDGSGQATLWDKARANTLAYLAAEFQNGWCLVDSLSIRNSPEAPDYLQGLFQYDLDLLIVMDPGSGIGEVSKFVDREVQDQDTYVSNCDEDGIFERYGKDSEDYPGALDYRVSGGTGKMGGDYVEWSEEFGTLEQSTTNYLYVSDGDGDGYGSVKEGTSGFPGNSVPLYEVDTGASSVNDIRDQRSCLTGTRLSDSERGDLNFVDELSVDDQLNFERLLAASDVLSVSDPIERWRGLADLSDSLAVADGPLDVLGVAAFTDTPSVLDGGSASGTGGTNTESNNWGTATDWDNAVSEARVVHAAFGDLLGGGILQQGYSKQPLGDPDLEAHYHFDEDSGSTFADVSGNANDLNINSVTLGATGLLGTTCGDYDGSSSYCDGSADLSGATAVSAMFWVNFDSIPSASTGHGGANQDDAELCLYRTNANDVFYIGAGSNDEVGFYVDAGDGGVSMETTTSPLSTNTWHCIICTWDGSTMRIYVDGTEEANASYSGTLESSAPEQYIGSAFGNYSYVDGRIEEHAIWLKGLSSSEVQSLYDTGSSGTLTTAYKEFSQDPDLSTLELANVAATLNGQSITVYVESDPDADGTFEETSDPISLDGSGGPHSVTGLTTSSSRFRLRVEPSTTAVTSAATFDSADLQGEVGTGGDADQNPNTQWEIQGAKHDTSGNEYEGGGVVSRYGAD